MDEKKVNFLTRFKTAEHRGFEITMFAISVLIGIVLLSVIVVLGIYWGKGASEKVSDDGDDAATSAAVIVKEESSEPTQTPGSLSLQRMMPIPILMRIWHREKLLTRPLM